MSLLKKLQEASVFQPPKAGEPRVKEYANRRNPKHKCNVHMEIDPYLTSSTLWISGDEAFALFLDEVGENQPEMDAPKINGKEFLHFVEEQLTKAGYKNVEAAYWEGGDITDSGEISYGFELETSTNKQRNINVKGVEVVFEPVWET